MVSVIITSWKEPKTIGRCISCIAKRSFSGITNPFEILQVSPDSLTLKYGKKEAKKLGLSKRQYIQIKDPRKGKPYALKMAIKRAKGDILIFTDGDTYFERGAVGELLKVFKDSSIGGVSGRPKSSDEKTNLFGYWGHLLSDSGDIHRKRLMSLNESKGYYTSEERFFPMSGYIMATRNLDFNIPRNVLSDDAYISYSIRNLGLNIAYTPNAICYVKFPSNFKDYLKQKVRSVGGFIQLKSFNVFQRDKQSRSFIIELGYAFYVIRYAKNIQELFWSLLLFPARLITWIKIFWDRILLKKDMPQNGWDRIESTK